MVLIPFILGVYTTTTTTATITRASNGVKNRDIYVNDKEGGDIIGIQKYSLSDHERNHNNGRNKKKKRNNFKIQEIVQLSDLKDGNVKTLREELTEYGKGKMIHLSDKLSKNWKYLLESLVIPSTIFLGVFLSVFLISTCMLIYKRNQYTLKPR